MHSFVHINLPTGAQMWNICNEPNWLIILVLLLFSIRAPLATVRVRSRAASKRLMKEFRNEWWVRYAREKKLDAEYEALEQAGCVGLGPVLKTALGAMISSVATSPKLPLQSVPEAQSRRSSDVVVLEKGVRQSAVELRAHEADVNIPLRCKLPVDNAGDRIQRTGALRVLFAVAGHDAGGRAEVGMLGVMVISGDHIHLVGNGVFDAGPIDVENPVSKTGGTERCIVDIRVVECLTSQANEVSRDIGKSHLRIAGRRISNLFEARIQLQGSIRVSGQHHHGSIVGDRRREHVRQERRYRVSISVGASAQNRGRYGIFHVAINCVEREHAVGEVRNIAAHPELVGAIGGVVLPVSTELPNRRHARLADREPVFQRRRVPAVFGIAAAAG